MILNPVFLLLETKLRDSTHQNNPNCPKIRAVSPAGSLPALGQSPGMPRLAVGHGSHQGPRGLPPGFGRRELSNVGGWVRKPLRQHRSEAQGPEKIPANKCFNHGFKWCRMSIHSKYNVNQPQIPWLNMPKGALLTIFRASTIPNK